MLIPRPGQLSLFELDARGTPQLEQIAAAPPRPVAANRPANHDESPGPSAGNGDDPRALLAGYLTQLAAAPASAEPRASGPIANSCSRYAIASSVTLPASSSACSLANAVASVSVSAATSSR